MPSHGARRVTCTLRMPGLANPANPDWSAVQAKIIAALPVPTAFVALSNTAVDPAVVGMPVMAPVAVTMLKPGGRGLAA